MMLEYAAFVGMWWAVFDFWFEDWARCDSAARALVGD
jgi:hypothetical protein